MVKVGDVVEGGEDAHLVIVTLVDGRDGQGVLTLVGLLEQDIEHDTLPKVFSALFRNSKLFCV